MSHPIPDERQIPEKPNESPAIDLPAYDPFLDVELTLLAVIDRRTISVHELFQLESDCLLSLSRPAGENIELFVGDVPVGTAEMLVTDERLAVRIAELQGRSAMASSEHGIPPRE